MQKCSDMLLSIDSLLFDIMAGLRRAIANVGIWLCAQGTKSIRLQAAQINQVRSQRRLV